MVLDQGRKTKGLQVLAIVRKNSKRREKVTIRKGKQTALRSGNAGSGGQKNINEGGFQQDFLRHRKYLGKAGPEEESQKDTNTGGKEERTEERKKKNTNFGEELQEEEFSLRKTSELAGGKSHLTPKKKSV